MPQWATPCSSSASLLVLLISALLARLPKNEMLLTLLLMVDIFLQLMV
jgi:hypothetical protein